MLSKHRRGFKARRDQSTRVPQEIAVTHNLSTAKAAIAWNYGRIVVTGVGDGDTIGDIVGVGCALAAIVVAPATNAPARIMPTNHRFIDSVLLRLV